MVEFKYIHVQSYLMNISVRQNMHLFMKFASNNSINKNVVGISFIIEMMHLVLFWRLMIERKI